MAWNVPMPIQPMKFIVAVGLAGHLTSKGIMTAGIITSAFVLFLSVTRLIGAIDRLVPKAVTYGVQMGLGISIAMSGVALINVLPWFSCDGIVTAAVLGALTFTSFELVW